MTESKGALLVSETTKTCLWTKLPKEIQDKILESLFSNKTFVCYGPWRGFVEEGHTYLMEYDVNRTAGDTLPNMFLISKTILSKTDVIDAIVRYSRIKLRCQYSILYLSELLSDAQKQIVKRVIVDDTIAVPEKITSKYLSRRIGKHIVHIKDHLRIDKIERASEGVSLCVPSGFLVERKEANFRYLELDDQGNLALMSKEKSETVMLRKLVKLRARLAGADLLIDTELRLTTDRPDLFVIDNIFKATICTRDWILRAWNDSMELRLPQALTAKFFRQQTRQNGQLRNSDIDLDQWIRLNA